MRWRPLMTCAAATGAMRGPPASWPRPILTRISCSQSCWSAWEKRMDPPGNQTEQGSESADFRHLVEELLRQSSGSTRRIVRLDRRPSAYRTSFPFDELDARLDDGAQLALLLKRLGWEELGPVAALVKPAFVHDPLREIAVYQRLLAPRRLGTAACYGSLVDPAVGRYWLLLERVPGRELYQEG